MLPKEEKTTDRLISPAVLPNGNGDFKPCPELLTEEELIRASNRMNPRDIYDRSKHIPTSERLHECQGGVHNEYANDGSDEAKTKSVLQPNEIYPNRCHARFDVLAGSDGYPLAAMPDDGVQSHSRDRLAHSPAGSGADPVVLR
jgi:hypothetical protein